MIYRTLGKTGLAVSEVGFGCGNVGGLMVRGSFEAQVRAVGKAIDLGINYFDTAPSYGDGLSESNLGKVLIEIKPKVVVATKIHLRDGLSDIRSNARRSLESSLKRLNRDYVDVFQLHDGITEVAGGGISGETIGIGDVLGKGGVADVFDDLRSEGLVRFTGFTGNGDTETLHAVVKSRRFEVIQAFYNLLNPSAGMEMPDEFSEHNFRQIIDRAAGHGMGVVIIRVMAAGAIGGPIARKGYAAPTIGSPMVTDSSYSSDEERALKLNFLLGGDLLTRPQAAVRFSLMHPGVSTTLVGFSGENQIQEAVTAVDANPFSTELMGQLHDFWNDTGV